MKTHTIKTPTAELLVVELPENSTFRELFGVIGADENNSPNYHLTEYKFSDYTLLGKPDEIREEDARELVGRPLNSYGEEMYPNYYGGIGSFIGFETAKESLLSAIESVVFWENPLSKPRWDEIAPLESWNDYQDAVDEWNEAELRTFDRSRSIILVKQ